MPRRRSFGLRFLILRPDTGKFAYQRDLNPDIAAFVEGEVQLD